MWFPWVFGSVFLLAGGIPLFLAIKTFQKDRAIARWPRAPGRITHSEIRSSRSSSRDKQGFTVETTLYEPIVTFTYTVDGQVLSGDRVAREVTPSSSKPDISRWPPAQDVLVLYDPNDPNTAYLETRVSTGAVILAIMGGVFAFVGILVPVLVLFAGRSR
jgi:hypothetical protein